MRAGPVPLADCALGRLRGVWRLSSGARGGKVGKGRVVRPGRSGAVWGAPWQALPGHSGVRQREAWDSGGASGRQGTAGRHPGTWRYKASPPGAESQAYLRQCGGEGGTSACVLGPIIAGRLGYGTRGYRGWRGI